MKSRARRLVIGLAASALCAGAPIGCRSTPRADRTGGVTVELYVAAPDRSFARYLLEPDGRLHYGGGVDAMHGKYVWSGEMTGEEIDRLLAMLEANAWFENKPDDAEGERTFEMWVRRSWMRNHIKVQGEVPDVVAVYDVLEGAARRRHDDVLRSLPKPGRQPN